MKFMKKPIVIEATQWFKNGDHPEDNCGTFDAGEGPFQGEGHVVRYYRHPQVAGTRVCLVCGHTMHEHGWIDTPGDVAHDLTVCPGDYVITDAFGKYSVCIEEVFVDDYVAYSPILTPKAMTAEEHSAWEALLQAEYTKWRDDPNYMSVDEEETP